MMMMMRYISDAYTEIKLKRKNFENENVMMNYMSRFSIDLV